jgi:hypothetical protein
MDSDGSKISRRELTILLILAMLLASCILSAALFSYTNPREPIYSAGKTADYDWLNPEHVPLGGGFAVFLDRSSSGEIVALETKSTTSGCKIKWHSKENLYIDPCCGASWWREGSPFYFRWGYAPLSTYRVEVTSGDEILIHLWQYGQGSETAGC